MKKYQVTIPIAGHITFEVEANSEKEAIEKAFEKDSATEECLIEWEMFDKFDSLPSPFCVDVELLKTN